MKKNTKILLRVFAVLLTLTLVAAVLPQTYATENASEFLSIVDNKYDFAGSGTKEDPYQIKSLADLKRLRDSVNVGVTYNGVYFRQVKDITFPEGENWVPIGNVSKDYYFGGFYDGNGHTLNNIHSEHQFASVFAWLKGEVRNLGIESGSFSGGTIGSIASHGTADAKIINCYNKASLTGNSRAGGITDNFGGDILFCWNFGELTATKEYTVLAGITSYSGYTETEIINTYTTADVLVQGSTYKGVVTDSEVVVVKDIESKLELNHEKMAVYEDRDLINSDNIVFMIWEDGELSFTDEVPGAYRTITLMEYIVPAFLAVVAILVVVAVITMKPFRVPAPAAAPVRKPKTSAEDAAEPVDKKAANAVATKRIVAVLLTVCMFAGGFSYVNGVLSNEYTAGVLNFNNFLDSETKPDVMFFGASTMSVNIELADLWTDYGYACFCLGAGGSSMYDSYYRLLEAEKTCVPELVILDVYAVTLEEEYRTLEFQQENISGLGLSANKLNFINVAVEPELRTDFLLNLPLFHDRYLSINKWDFLHSSLFGTDDKGTWTFFYGNPHSPTLNDPKQYTTYRAIHEKQEFYLRKIIEHCEDEKIDLLLIKTPDANRAVNQPYYNTVELLAEEYQVPFLNMNFYDEEIGLNSTDFYYDDIHLNVVGARKCTKLLGDYLKEHYNLTDHRGDEDYDSWNRFKANRDTLYMTRMNGNYDYLNEIARNGKKLIVVPYKTETINSEAYNSVMNSLNAIGYETWDFPENSNVIVKNTYELDDNTFEVSRNYSRCQIRINDEKNASINSPGIMLIVYDEVLDEVADVVSFTQAKEFNMERLYWSR